MSPTIRWFLCVAAILPPTLVAFSAKGQDDLHPTSIEIAQLPRMCWGQMGVPNAVGPEFNMPPPKDCGYAMNHYCLGLVDLIRAKHAPNKGQRLSYLGTADSDIRYTERAMKDYPNCSIREHVAASRAEVNNLLLIYGGKRPQTP